MKKLGIALFIALMIFPLISAIELSIEKQSSGEVLIVGLEGPVVFDLNITNLGGKDDFKFYNLIGFEMFPIGRINFNTSETKNIELKISPISELDHRGSYTFEYFIQGNDGSEVKERLTFRIIEMESVFEVGSGEIDLDTNSLEIYVKNTVNYNFENINAKLSSVFFDFEGDFSLGPYEKKTFDVEFNKDSFKELMAGFYTLNAELTAGGEKANIEGVIKFLEKDILTTTKKDYGFIVNTQIIEKINEGNVLVKSETVIKKSIIARLFTSMSPEPDSVDRSGSFVYYTWSRQIKPGENLEITVRTNWFFPLLIVILLIVIVVLAKLYKSTNLVLRKRVTFVKAKGGEFALKISIFVHAKKYMERVSIIDRIPPLVKVYEKFGKDEPTKVDERNKRIEWNYEKLEAGETRLLTYIVYSKIGVLGKFALPSTTAVYEKEGKIHESISNKAFFVAEQIGKDKLEE